MDSFSCFNLNYSRIVGFISKEYLNTLCKSTVNFFLENLY